MQAEETGLLVLKRSVLSSISETLPVDWRISTPCLVLLPEQGNVNNLLLRVELEPTAITFVVRGCVAVLLRPHVNIFNLNLIYH